MKNFTIFSLIIAYFLSTSTSDAINTSVNSDFLESDSIIVADSLSVSTDTIASNVMSVVESVAAFADTLSALSDSVATDIIAVEPAVVVDSIVTIADSLLTDTVSSLSDSISVATDSLPADSLSSLPDSIGVVADTLFTDSLSMVSDSIKAVSDSISAVKDSLAVAKKRIIEALATRETYDETLKTPLSVYKKMPERDRALLISYYKNLIKEDQTGEAYVKAYIPWREAFMATPGSEKTLDMYVDGVGIIIANIDTDTLHHKPDSIHILTEDLMELYNLAVRNVDVLNSQIDFTKTKDSITVAKLRAQQVRHYRNFFEIDSMFHSTHHTNYNDAADIQFWEDYMFRDSTQIEILYPWYIEILTSPDTDIDITHVAHFAKLLHMKTAKESKILGGAVAKENFFKDRAIAEEKAKILLENADPSVIVDENRNLNQKDYYAGQFRSIENTFNLTQSGFIAANDYAALEKIFEERLNKEGPAVLDELLASGLQNSDSSEVYIRALQAKYEMDPSFDIVMKLASKTSKLKKYYKNAMEYYEMAFAYPEFYDLSEFQQARYYFRMAQFLNNAGQRNKCISYIDKAKETCPEYPEPYYLEVVLFQNATKNVAGFNGYFCYCISYDLYSGVKKCIEELQAKSETDVTTTLEIADIEKSMRDCYARFPKKTQEDIFMGRYTPGNSHSIKVLGRTYSAIIRVVD